MTVLVDDIAVFVNEIPFGIDSSPFIVDEITLSISV